MRDTFCVLIVILLNLLMIRYAFPENLPEPVRLPTPMFSTDECDCDACCCAPLCNCKSLDYDVALKKAIDQEKPLVIFLNTRVCHVPGCVVTHATSYPEIDFRVGVIIGTPLAWEDPKVKCMRELVCLFGPQSPEKITSWIKEHRAKCLLKRFKIATTPPEPCNGAV